MEASLQAAGDGQAPTRDEHPSEEPNMLEKNDVFHLLQNSRRRNVVRYFSTFDGPVGIGDLADQVAAWECDTTVDDVTKDQRQRVYIALYQSHLDKLDEHGVVRYDDDEGTVIAGANLPQLATHIGATTDDVPSSEPAPATDSGASRDWSMLWPGCYLGIALGGLLPLTGHSLHLVPSDVLSLQVLNVVLVTTYVVAASLQYLASR